MSRFKQSAVPAVSAPAVSAPAPINSNPNDLFTSVETSRTLRLHRKTLAKLCRDRKINFIRVGGKYLFRKNAIDLFLAQRETKAKGNDDGWRDSQRTRRGSR